MMNAILHENIVNAEWDKVLKHMKRIGVSNMAAFFSKEKSFHCMSCLQRQKFLHYICQYDPTMEVITYACALLKKNLSTSNFLLAEDCEKRLPLHVAICNQARHEIIDILLEQCKISALHQDAYGRTPLHLACLFLYSRSRQNDQDQVLMKLMHIAPASLLIEDMDGKTPLEFALEREDICEDEDYEDENDGSNRSIDSPILDKMVIESRNARRRQQQEKKQSLVKMSTTVKQRRRIPRCA